MQSCYVGDGVFLSPTQCFSMGSDFAPSMVRRPTQEEIADQSRRRAEAREQERVLVAQLRASEPAALAALMTQYTNRLARFAFYTVGSRDSAEDIVQQVFVQLWETRLSLPQDLHLKAYLFRLVRNRALDERRRMAVRDHYRTDVQVKVDAGMLRAYVPSPENDVLISTAFQAAIEHLPRRRRLAIRLRFQEEMTHAEIGEILGISPVAARLLLARALVDLRKLLCDE